MYKNEKLAHNADYKDAHPWLLLKKNVFEKVLLVHFLHFEQPRNSIRLA